MPVHMKLRYRSPARNGKAHTLAANSLPILQGLTRLAGKPPMSQAPVDPSATPSVEPEPVRPQVLVVDDDAAVCAALQRLLGSEGYAVSTFQSAESFLARHDPLAWGCVILDVAMPGGDGLALQQSLAQRGNQLPIIFLSGAADVPMCAQAMRRGALDFLTKPVDEEVLFAAVERALQRDAELLSARAQRDATASRLA